MLLHAVHAVTHTHTHTDTTPTLCVCVVLCCNLLHASTMSCIYIHLHASTCSRQHNTTHRHHTRRHKLAWPVGSIQPFSARERFSRSQATFLFTSARMVSRVDSSVDCCSSSTIRPVGETLRAQRSEVNWANETTFQQHTARAEIRGKLGDRHPLAPVRSSNSLVVATFSSN